MSVLISSEEILLHAKVANSAYTPDSNSVTLSSHSWKLRFNDDSKTLTIAIKGSDSMEEWFLNTAMPFAMFLSQVNFAEEDHRVIVNVCSTLDNYSYAVIAKRIVEDALTKFPQAKKFDICGHSRGGLLAVFCGMVLVHKPQARVRIFAYGAPNLYYSSNDTETANKLEALKSNIVWVEHEHDIVPQVANRARETTAEQHLDRKIVGFESIVLRNPVVGGHAHSMQTYIAGITALVTERRALSQQLTNTISEVVSNLLETDPLTPQQLAPVVNLTELLFDLFKLRK